MKKPVMFCMRMSSTMREALRKAAEKDHRSVTSLLQKIITDYLAKEDLSIHEYAANERRRFPRKRLALPAITRSTTGRKVETVHGQLMDISLGGVLLAYSRNSNIKAFSSEGLPNFELIFQLPGMEETVCFNCRPRRMLNVDSEIRVGAEIRDADEVSMQKLRSCLM